RWLNRVKPDLDEARDNLKNIVLDGHRASEVVQSVKAMFSGNDQGGTPVDINELIQETIALLHSDLEAASVSVRLELSPKLPAVQGHRGQLQQIILNIITNAADAMRAITDRTRVLQVKSAALESNRIMISLEDTGTGIESKDLERIFD